MLTEYNGLILSPGYPESYPPSLDCSFKISLDESSLKLALFFTKFDLESSANCANDYLQIDSQPKICGQQLPDPYFKNSNQIDIRFRTNENLGGKIYPALRNCSMKLKRGELYRVQRNQRIEQRKNMKKGQRL